MVSSEARGEGISGIGERSVGCVGGKKHTLLSQRAAAVLTKWNFVIGSAVHSPPENKNPQSC